MLAVRASPLEMEFGMDKNWRFRYDRAIVVCIYLHTNKIWAGMNKLSYLLNIVLIGVVGYGAYKFINGNAEATDDGRTAIVLTFEEREFLLADMRTFLETVQAIVAAAGEGDMAAVAEIATANGIAATGNEPAALMAKIPLEMKQLGFGTHDRFDVLAALATESNDPTKVIVELGDLMTNCTGCHAGYRFDVEE